MRRITLLFVGMLALFSAAAQRKNFTYKFYGFVRGDLFYNSRANMASIDGNFYLYPLDKSFDADGKDLNATPNVLNLSTGAPFQPFNPSPQIRYQYKANNRVQLTAFSYEVHLKYSGRNYTFATKILMTSALDHTALLGGYGVSSVDSYTDEQEYTPFRHSTTWVNFAYGTKWRQVFFVGYTKHLGIGKSLVSADKVYGIGYRPINNRQRQHIV